MHRIPVDGKVAGLHPVPMPLVRVVLATVVLALCATPADAAGTIDRLYLLSAPGGTAYYGPDPADPEANGGSLEALCSQQVSQPTVRNCQFSFLPAVALDEPLRWSPDAPLRFHAELDVTTPAEAAVTFFVQAGGSQLQTPPATQVAPGVWEATLEGPGSLSRSLVGILGVRLRGTGAHALTVRTRGRSWVDIGSPAPGSSVREMLGASPAPAAPSTHTTGTRRFEFADGEWDAQRFDGTLAAEGTHAVTLPRAATAVYAWVEHANGPFVHALARGQAPDPQWQTDLPSLTIRRGGASIGDGGSTARAARDVTAGPLELRVARSPAAQGKPYTVHMVAVYGSRTLRSMRWRTTGANSVTGGIVSACPHLFNPLVVPSTVSTFSVGLTWSSPNPVTRWALAYDIPTMGAVVCGDRTSDPAVRFVLPRESRLMLFEPRLVTGQPTASVADTVFEFEAQLAYVP